LEENKSVDMEEIEIGLKRGYKRKIDYKCTEEPLYKISKIINSEIRKRFQITSVPK
jgi:hypothetical protein